MEIPYAHLQTLACLEGKIQPPSRFMSKPAKLLSGPSMLYGLWPDNLCLAKKTECRFLFRERELTEEEQRVALPSEISMAQKLNLKKQYKQIWALRSRGKPALPRRLSGAYERYRQSADVDVYEAVFANQI